MRGRGGRGREGGIEVEIEVDYQERKVRGQNSSRQTIFRIGDMGCDGDGGDATRRKIEGEGRG